MRMTCNPWVGFHTHTDASTSIVDQWTCICIASFRWNSSLRSQPFATSRSSLSEETKLYRGDPYQNIVRMVRFYGHSSVVKLESFSLKKCSSVPPTEGIDLFVSNTDWKSSTVKVKNDSSRSSISNSNNSCNSEKKKKWNMNSNKESSYDSITQVESATCSSFVWSHDVSICHTFVQEDLEI